MCGLLRYEILTTKQSKQIFPPKITDGETHTNTILTPEEEENEI